MLRIITLVIFIFVFVLSGCNEEEMDSFVCQTESVYPCGTDSNRVNLRIVNVSSYDYCNVKVWGDGISKNYGEIPQGDTSCYISFDTLFNVLSIHLIFEGDTATTEPEEHLSGYKTDGLYICKVGLTVVTIDSRRHGNIQQELIQE